MRAKLLLFFVLVGMATNSGAQTTVSIASDPASKADVQKLFDVMASRDQVRQMMQQVFAQMKALNRAEMKKRRPDITDEEMARVDSNSDDFIKNFPVDEMLNDMIPVYQRHFTKSEIDSLTAFYSSPTGQKFLHEMPAVTSETMQTVFPRIQASVDAALKQADQKHNSNQK